MPNLHPWDAAKFCASGTNRQETGTAVQSHSANVNIKSPPEHFASTSQEASCPYQHSTSARSGGHEQRRLAGVPCRDQRTDHLAWTLGAVGGAHGQQPWLGRG